MITKRLSGELCAFPSEDCLVAHRCALHRFLRFSLGSSPDLEYVVIRPSAHKKSGTAPALEDVMFALSDLIVRRP